MEVAACPRCASTDLAPATVADGLFPGGAETQLWVCRACDYRGAPLLFDGPAEHAAFRAALAAGGGDGDAEDGRGEAVGGAGDGADPEDEAPAWAAEALAAPPVPRRARGTAVFVRLVGLAVALGGAWVVAAGASRAVAGQALVGLSVLLAALAGVGVGVAFLRIAARQWRGA